MERVVQLSNRDYNALVNKAEQNEQEIEKRAHEMYKENGYLGVNVNLSYIHKRDGYLKDQHSEKFDTEISIQDWKGKHTMPVDQKKKLIKFVKRKLDWFMENEFGDAIYEIERIREAREEYENKTRKSNVSPFSGWAIGILIAIVFLVSK